MVLREGDERLSGKLQNGDPGRDDVAATPTAPVSKGGSGRKDKAGPIGRALRTVYDDMLRESVPSDFLDLLNKLD